MFFNEECQLFHLAGSYLTQDQMQKLHSQTLTSDVQSMQILTNTAATKKEIITMMSIKLEIIILQRSNSSVIHEF